jgi:hypothetical protein
MAVEVDTTGLTRAQRVESPGEGIRDEQVATVRLHAELPDGRTIQIMPTGDIRGVVPKGAKIIWHERMGITPQDVALAGQEPTSGAEVVKPLASMLGDTYTNARLDEMDREIARLKEELARRTPEETIAEREAELEALKAALADPKRVRTTIKPGPSVPTSPPAVTSAPATPAEKAK